MAHKKNRTLQLGEHVTLLFEDELTIRYQIQEMLRAERIFEEDGIQGELDAYNPLMPDGGNWKATMMIEYPDIDERAPADARAADRHRGPGLGAGGRLPQRFTPWRTRIWAREPSRRPRRCISCAWNWIRP